MKETNNHLNHLRILAAILLALLACRCESTPISIAGFPFIQVATDTNGIELYGLTSDPTGRVYAGNNSNGPGIPVRLFDPSLFSGSVITLQDFGPVCNDGDGIAYCAGFLFVADTYAGVRKIAVPSGAGTVFLPGVTVNLSGSPLACRSADGHLFVGGGGQTGVLRIDEYDAAGGLVTNYPTAIEIETMTFNESAGVIYYAPYVSDGPTPIHALTLATRSDVALTSISGAVDGGLSFDPVSQSLFVGTANGANQGRVYTVNPQTGATALFAAGFDGCLGIHRAAGSGDLFFLEATNLYKLGSNNIVFKPAIFIWPAIELGWLSDTSEVYQVQWAAEANTNVWFNLGPPQPGNGTTNFYFDTTRNQPRKFYRLQVSP